MNFQSCVSLLLLLISAINGYRILYLAPFYGKSHWMFNERIIKSLLERQHEVTCVTSMTFTGTKPANYTEVLIDPPFIFDNVVTQEQRFRTKANTPFPNINRLSYIGQLSAEHAFKDRNVQNLIYRQDLQYDLVINEEFFHDSFLMFAHKFKAPLLTISTYGTSNFFDNEMGLLTPVSHVPHVILSYSDDMSFSERFHNAALSLYECFYRRYFHLPTQMGIARKYFPHLEPLPSLEDLSKNISVILVNTHRSVLRPRPVMPGIINIGGAHVEAVKRLPVDLQTLLDKSKNGVIYFSLGTFLKSSKMPRHKLHAFLDTFRLLKQQVIWKYDDESIPDLPPNVMIRKWLPQNDILAHPHVVLFISHGGMFGLFESISHGVPMLIIPFYGDQYRNSIHATKTGYGMSLEFECLTKNSLFDSIQELTRNESYANKAKEISAIYNDNLVHPMDETMFWIEYVSRHKGAKHLKSHATDMSLFSYLLLDVFIAATISVAVFVYFTYLLIKYSLKTWACFMLCNEGSATKKRN